MLIRFAATSFLITTFASFAASEIRSQNTVGTEVTQDTHTLSEPVVWKPSLHGLTRFTLTLPHQGIHEALIYQDTASLFYLSSVVDNGIALAKHDNPSLEILLKAETSSFHYRQDFTPALSLSVGTRFERNETLPLLGGKFRWVAGRNSLQQNSILLSDTDLHLFSSYAKLSPDEQTEEIWSLSLGLGQERVSYGYRWFDIVRNDSLIAEVGLIDEELVLGWQFEHYFEFLTAYFGSLTNTASHRTETFWGVRHNFGTKSEIRIEHGPDLLSGSTQSLRSLRKMLLPNAWRSNLTKTGSGLRSLVGSRTSIK